VEPLSQLTLATAAFLVTHFVASTPLRAGLAGSIGERAYLGIYSLFAFATLGWMIYAYGAAPADALWPGLRLVPAAVMPFAFILIACALLQKNPTAVGQSRFLAQEDAARGILRVTRHPMMWGIMLWAGAHVLARGDLKSVVFFGGFLLLAALGTRFIDARRARERIEEWKRFALLTSNIPFLAIAQGRNVFRIGEIGAGRIAAGLVAYAIFLFAHPWLFGARPW
jgi:uncharacterized membrane protein